MDNSTLIGMFILLVVTAVFATGSARDKGEDVSYFTMLGYFCMLYGCVFVLFVFIDNYKTTSRVNEKIDNSTFIIEYNINCELEEYIPDTYCPKDSIKYIEVKFNDINWSLRKLEKQLNMPFKSFWIDSTYLADKIKDIVTKKTYSDILVKEKGWYGKYRPYKFYEYKIYEKRK